MEHLASCYSIYLSSTRKLSELQKIYKGKEKSVEESANIVGLKIPKKND